MRIAPFRLRLSLVENAEAPGGQASVAGEHVLIENESIGQSEHGGKPNLAGRYAVAEPRQHGGRHAVTAGLRPGVLCGCGHLYEVT